MNHTATTHRKMIVLVMLIFFLISFATNILNAIISEVRTTFGLSLAATGLLPFAFFIAYGIMSVPAGYLTEFWSSKKIITLSLLCIVLASVGFVLMPEYQWFLLTLFLLGSSMAVLQVVINPLLRTAGGGEHFAFYSLLAQLVFGGASFLSPLVYRRVVDDGSRGFWSSFRSLINVSVSWTTMYVIFAVMALLLIVVVRILRFPKVAYLADEQPGRLHSFKELLNNRLTYFYFFGIFAYVGVEQGIGNWISPFLHDYHGVDPAVQGALVVSRFWGMLTLGCILGLFLVRLIDSRKVLLIFTVLSMASLGVALTAKRDMALLAFPACGFFISVMWSVIFSLALNSVRKYHGSFSGILCTGIAGGAFVPMLIGVLGQYLELRNGMYLLFVPLAYILVVALRAAPIIRNKTLFGTPSPSMADEPKEVPAE